LELAFANKALRHICESQLTAERELGIEIAKKLRARLSDLRAASSIADLVASTTEKLDQASERMAFALSSTVRIIFCANHVKIPRTRSGEVNWQKVSRIKLLEIEVAHG